MPSKFITIQEWHPSHSGGYAVEVSLRRSSIHLITAPLQSTDGKRYYCVIECGRTKDIEASGTEAEMVALYDSVTKDLS